MDINKSAWIHQRELKRGAVNGTYFIVDEISPILHFISLY